MKRIEFTLTKLIVPKVKIRTKNFIKWMCRRSFDNCKAFELCYFSNSLKHYQLESTFSHLQDETDSFQELMRFFSNQKEKLWNSMPMVIRPILFSSTFLFRQLFYLTLIDATKYSIGFIRCLLVVQYVSI